MKPDKNLPSLYFFKTCFLTFLLFVLSGCTSEHPGEAVYRTKCSQCHGISGQGLKKLYPPLENSRYLSERVAMLPCLIRNGSTFLEKHQSGKTRNFMPAIQQLKVADLSLLLDYLQQQFAANPIDISPQSVEKWLLACTP